MTLSVVKDIHANQIARREDEIEDIRSTITELYVELYEKIEYLDALKKCTHTLVPGSNEK